MTLLLEAEMRAYIATLDATMPTDKAGVRDVLLTRKLETLLAAYDALKTQQSRALNLMKRVDYEHIEPVLVHVSDADLPLWKYVRMCVSSAPFLGRPGRSNFVFCLDKRSKGLLGVLEIGSDMQSLGVRDRYIGWSNERKYNGGLNHIGNVGTCVSVEPFGLLTGGKFMIVASTSETFVDLWSHKYGEKLAAVLVTSLFGKSSVYNRLTEFTYLGNTPGQGTAHVSKDGVRLLKRFVHANNLRTRSGGHGLPMDNKNDLLERACAVLKIDRASIESHQPRGVYLAPLGDQALPFLRGEISEADFEPSRRSQRDIADWWTQRWYANRMQSQRDKVLAFDFDTYRLDAQIELCRAAAAAGDDDAAD
jgi:hypothetical protein